jgi:RNA exonuclease 4
LVHKSGGRASTSSLKVDSKNGATELPEVDEEDELRRKKRVILGGEELSKEKQEPGTYIAIDCEMVGVGPEGSESVLARVSLVNWHGALLYDSFVKPREKVTDYRTWVSGVRAEDLHTAPEFTKVQAEVAKLIKGKVLVGHAIHNDLKALLLSHPRPLIRDTAQSKLCRELANSKYPSLRKLVALRLGIDIQKQGSEHSSVEDARATMALYRTLHADWQKSMSRAIIGKGWKKPEKKPATVDLNTKAKTLPSKSSNTDWWKEV